MNKACRTHGETRNAYKILVKKPDAKGPLGRVGHRCKENTKMKLKETACGAMDRVQWRESCEHDTNLQVPYQTGISRSAEQPLLYKEWLCSMGIGYTVSTFQHDEQIHYTCLRNLTFPYQNFIYFPET
jgi:hypothetical protein